MKLTDARAPAVFGMADGLTATLGIISGLIISHQSPHAVWRAALSVGVAEFAGMGWGQYESSPQDGWDAALVCGAASLAAIVVPAVPYAFLAASLTWVISVVLVATFGLLVALWRPEQGWRAVARTYGLLAVAAALVCAANLI
jgi:VIT1/CCC1 family predicted Fe2+/Mn2+ transporter